MLGACNSQICGRWATGVELSSAVEETTILTDRSRKIN